MTFNFGFATDNGFYLAADRRRVHERPVQKVEDSSTKLHKVNRWTYLTGAGFLYFVDDVIAPQALSVFGHGPQDTGILERDLPRLTEQLAGGFAQIANQAGAPDPQGLFSKFVVAGMDASGQPFSSEWTSKQGFVGVTIGRRHSFFLPRAEAAENEALREMIVKMQGLAVQGASLKHLAQEARQVMSWVAERDEAVSAIGDIVSISAKGSKLRAFK